MVKKPPQTYVRIEIPVLRIKLELPLRYSKPFLFRGVLEAKKPIFALKTQNPPMSSTKINATNAPKPVGSYPHARRAGNLLFLSGIGPRDPETDGVPGLTRSPSGNFTSFDFEAQVHAVFKHVRTVLEASGAQWEDLVDVTVFLVNMERDFHTFNRIYAEYFNENQPCRTTVGIDSLPTPIAIELKCVALVS